MGEGKRLNSDAPHNKETHPPRGTPSASPTARNNSSQGRTLWGQCWAPMPTPIAPGTHASRNPGRPPKRTGGRGRDSAWHQTPLTMVAGHPPRGRPPTTPGARSPHRACKQRESAGPRHLYTSGCSTLIADPDSPPRGRAPAGGTAPELTPPSQRWKAAPPGTDPHHPRGTQPPTEHASQGDSAGPPHPHSRAHSTLIAGPDSPPRGRAAGRGVAPELRRPPQRRTAPPLGTLFGRPQGAQRRLARAHAVGLVLGPHAHTNRTRDTRLAEPWPPGPEGGRPGEGQRLTPDAPRRGGRPPPPETAPTILAARSPHRAYKPRGQCWAPRPHIRADGTWVADPDSPPRERGSQGRGSA